MASLAHTPPMLLQGRCGEICALRDCVVNFPTLRILPILFLMPPPAVPIALKCWERRVDLTVDLLDSLITRDLCVPVYRDTSVVAQRFGTILGARFFSGHVPSFLPPTSSP